MVMSVKLEFPQKMPAGQRRRHTNLPSAGRGTAVAAYLPGGARAMHADYCRQRRQPLLLVLLLVLLCSVVGPAQAMVETLVSQSDIIEGEPFRVIYRIDSAGGAHPDLTPLGTDFRIRRRSTSTNLAIVGGRTKRSTTLTLELVPLRSGALTLPAIEFANGERSTPQSIEVLEPQPVVDDGLPDIIVELTADTLTPYVQAQVRVTMRLLRRVELGQNAALNEPATDQSVLMKRLGEDDRRYRERRFGERYIVHEREFAIFPQESGTLTLGPAVFEGEVIADTQSMRNPFAPAVVFERVPSNILELEVKPIPASFTGDVWLPAKRLDLHEEYSTDQDTLHVGDPLVRTMFLWADGLTSGQLPEIAVKTDASVTVYPEPAQTNDQESKQGYASVRQQDFTLIPSATGPWRLPPIEIAWWNTETDQQEVAQLPGRGFTTLPPRGAAGTIPPSATGTGAEAGSLSEDTKAIGGPTAANAKGDNQTLANGPADAINALSGPTGRSDWVAILAALSTLGWLVTLVVLLLMRKARGAAASTTQEGAEPDAGWSVRVKPAHQEVEKTLAQGNAQAIRASLLEFGRAYANARGLAQAPRTISDLVRLSPAGAGADADATQQAFARAITALEARFYQSDGPRAALDDADTEALRAGVAELAASAEQTTKPKRNARNAGLPAMYPLVDG